MSYRRVSVSAFGAAAVSTADMKAHLRVDHSDEDALIDAYTEAATRYVEKGTGTALRSQTWVLSLPSFPVGPVSLPGGRVTAVSSVQYLDRAGVLQTLAPAEYTLADAMVPALIETSAVWPATSDRADAVTITYTVDASNEPSLLQAVRLLTSHWYENREAGADRAMELPFGVPEIINMNAAGWYG